MGRFRNTLIIIIFFTAFSRPMLAGGDSLAINILSKHLRVMHEGMLDTITFHFQSAQGMRDSVSGRVIQSKFLKLSMADGLLNIEYDGGILPGTLNLDIPGTIDSGYVRVKLPGDTRVYPLPMNIISSGGKASITVMEDRGRYARDSAWAEYGGRRLDEMEAVSALADVIHARGISRSIKKTHQGYDFCDLTHCQVYRGRPEPGKGAARDRDQAWFIDGESLKQELLFHSRCGGTTFDSRIFTTGKAQNPGVNDRLYRFSQVLCKGPDSSWERSIESSGLLKIVAGEFLTLWDEKAVLKYDRENMTLVLTAGERRRAFPPETFRLAVNREKGWNFIKSNNFTVSKGGGSGELILFKGEGLGHGVGLCQHGALELSRQGFSRAEILYHYYPDIILNSTARDPAEFPGISFAVFNRETGGIIKSRPAAMEKRRVPPGSLWKLILAQYLARERQDLFTDYRYVCTGKGGNISGKCWKLKGHGSQGIEEALANSCNLWFASLHDKITSAGFNKFYSGLCRALGMANTLPEVKDAGEWAGMLSGTDFRITVTVADLIKIAGIIDPGSGHGPGGDAVQGQGPGLNFRLSIMKGLLKSFTGGTARYPSEESASLKKRYLSDFTEEMREKLGRNFDGMWGKTSTVIDGTNRPLSYGMFLGGYNNLGVVVVLRDGTGHLAAQWGKLILLSEITPTR